MAKFGPRRRPPGVGEEQRRRPKEKWCRRREKGFWCLLAATSWHLRARLGGGGRSSTPGIGVVRELHVPHSQGCTSVHKRHICHPDHVARQAFRRRVGGHESGGGESGGACVEASRTSGTLWRRQPFWGRASDGGAGTPTKAGHGATTRTEDCACTRGHRADSARCAGISLSRSPSFLPRSARCKRATVDSLRVHICSVGFSWGWLQSQHP